MAGEEMEPVIANALTDALTVINDPPPIADHQDAAAEVLAEVAAVESNIQYVIALLTADETPSQEFLDVVQDLLFPVGEIIQEAVRCHLLDQGRAQRLTTMLMDLIRLYALRVDAKPGERQRLTTRVVGRNLRWERKMASWRCPRDRHPRIVVRGSTRQRPRRRRATLGSSSSRTDPPDDPHQVDPPSPLRRGNGGGIESRDSKLNEAWQGILVLALSPVELETLGIYCSTRSAWEGRWAA